MKLFLGVYNSCGHESEITNQSWGTYEGPPTQLKYFSLLQFHHEPNIFLHLIYWFICGHLYIINTDYHILIFYFIFLKRIKLLFLCKAVYKSNHWFGFQPLHSHSPLPHNTLKWLIVGWPVEFSHTALNSLLYASASRLYCFSTWEKWLPVPPSSWYRLWLSLACDVFVMDLPLSKPLYMAQNALMHLVFNQPKRVHFNPLLIDHHWLPINFQGHICVCIHLLELNHMGLCYFMAIALLQGKLSGIVVPAHHGPDSSHVWFLGGETSYQVSRAEPLYLLE